MSEWTVTIPYRSLSDSLVEVGGYCRHLYGEDRDVTRALVLRAKVDGIADTAAELVDFLDALEPHERRAFLDRARAECGLPTATQIDADNRLKVLQEEGRARGKGLQGCPHCNRLPTNAQGHWIEVDVRRWHCPGHRHLAAPGDMSPEWIPGPSGALIPSPDSDEMRHEAVRQETARVQRDALLAERAVEAAALEASREGERERFISELPPHLRP